MAQPPPQYYDQYGQQGQTPQWNQGSQKPNTFVPTAPASNQTTNDVSFDFNGYTPDNSQGSQSMNTHSGEPGLHQRHTPGSQQQSAGTVSGSNSGFAGAPTSQQQSANGPSVSNIFNPAQSMPGGDALFNHFVQQGTQHFVQQGSQIVNDPNVVMRYVPGLAMFYSSLKYYFNVSNNYVKNKLQILLFPFRHKHWMRERAHTSQDGDSGSKMAPPVADINAPDLYIPTMAFVTYVLLVGLLQGVNAKFSPEGLQHTFNSCITTTVLEVLIMKVSMYFLTPAVSMSWLDLTVYSAYKYVGVSLNLLVGLSTGVLFYNIALCYTGGCMAYFIYQTMEKVVPEPSIDHSGRKRRIYLLGMFAALQLVSMWWLGYTRDFQSTAILTGMAPTESGLEVLDPLESVTSKASRGRVSKTLSPVEDDYEG